MKYSIPGNNNLHSLEDAQEALREFVIETGYGANIKDETGKRIASAHMEYVYTEY